MAKSLQTRSDNKPVELSQQVSIPNLFKKIVGPATLSLDGTLSSKGTLQQDLALSGLNFEDDTKFAVTTTDVSFTLTPRLTLSSAVQAIKSIVIDLGEFPLGDTGLEGPFGSKIGLFLQVGVQASLGDVQAEIDASIDIELALSDGKVEWTDPGSKPSVTGFHPTFSVHSPDIKGQVDLTSSVGSTIALVMQANLDNVGAYV